MIRFTCQSLLEEEFHESIARILSATDPPVCSLSSMPKLHTRTSSQALHPVTDVLTVELGRVVHGPDRAGPLHMCRAESAPVRDAFTSVWEAEKSEMRTCLRKVLSALKPPPQLH